MALASSASMAVWAQTAIPASFAHPRSTATAANRGFAVRVVQAYKDAGTLANSNARTEAQLAGTLINSLTGLPFVDVTDKTGFSADGVYTETAVIDYEKGGGATAAFPGIPSGSDNTDNIALEAVAFLDLDPGTYTMVVNSDDGFRVTAGPDSRDQLNSIKLGEYDGGRGAGDTSFTFSVSAAGIYSFRLTYEQGNGGANVSWFAAPSTAADPHVLVNAADGIKAYSTLVGGVAPYVALANPLPGATGVSPATVVNFVLVDGTPAKVNPASVALYFDGVKTASTASKAGSKTTISYDPPGLLDVLSKHTVKLTFADDAIPANLRTNEFTFESAAFGNLKLPAPIYLENFDSIAEATLPAGWTAENHTDVRTEGLDLNNPNSDSYLGWTVISSNRMWFIGEGAKTPEAATNNPVLGVPEQAQWEALRRFTVGEQYVNGERVTSLVTNNFAYAETDQRGGSQVQYLFTKDYDLTGKTSIYLSYHSMYEQNQDNMASVEYSIDAGKTWLPVVIMVDGVDIKLDANGKALGYETLIEPQGDTAKFTDAGGNEAGGYYGAFIGNQDTNTWKDLGPFISARVNDDFTESKRVELFRLTNADNQKTVRLRFAQAGTGSWYFGIDDVGFYSIPSHLFSEDFESIVLGPNVEEGITTGSGGAKPNVWSKAGPAGWTHDDTGVPGLGTANDGVTEWAGWSFANREWWASTAGNQRRAEFLKGTGAVAIADSDEWDDIKPHAAGNMATYLSTPAIDITGQAAGTVYLKFDSSWRPEEPQKATVVASYDGGAPVEVLRWESAAGKPFFHDDNSVNETVNIPLFNPAGAKSVKLTFGYFDTLNNWWWAIDNIEVNVGPAAVAPLGGTTASVTPAGIVLSWTGGNGPFLVQRKLGVTDAWTDLQTTADRTTTIPTASSAGFFRIVTN